jgi:hypothetical protein
MQVDILDPDSGRVAGKPEVIDPYFSVSCLPTIRQVEHKQFIGNGHLIGSSLRRATYFFALICNRTGHRIF